jgi:hypothetical protein
MSVILLILVALSVVRGTLERTAAGKPRSRVVLRDAAAEIRNGRQGPTPDLMPFVTAAAKVNSLTEK